MEDHNSSRSGTVVITGASSGIGQACALRLDHLGFRVFAGVRKEADAAALRHKASDRLTPLFLDVTDSAQISEAAAAVARAVGNNGLSGLVNNAGIGVGGPLEFLPLDELRLQFEINVFGQVAVTQAFLPLLRQGRGRIVNIGSIAGRSVLPFSGPYCASKFALEAITDALRMELLPWGVAVAIVEPGSVVTPIWEKTLTMIDRITQKLPPKAHQLYGPAVAAVVRILEASGRNGIPADEVAKTVEHALTAQRPKTRYVVGREARMRVVLQMLPDGMRDRLITAQIARSV